MKKWILTLLTICLLVLTGCEEQAPSAAVTCYPLRYLVERIGGTTMHVENISSNDLIQRASIRTDYQQVLDEVDVLFYISSLEPYMEMYYDEIRENCEMVDLAVRSAIYKFARYATTFINGNAAVVSTPYYEGSAFGKLDTYENDPMLWLDPVAMTSMASDIRDFFVEKYPENSMLFNENYNQLELDLARLDAGFSAIYNEKKSISFVSMTPSFGNWQKSYGIHVYPISLSRYGALPSEAQLEIIKTRIRNDHVRYIALEDNLSEDFIQLREELIEELGLIPVKLSNLSSLSDTQMEQGGDYLSIMYQNLETLKKIAE